MPKHSVIEPKQQRSQETQRKLLQALHTCLKDKFFEHISIKELAELAGVSVGTFYRRFKDKESLLPLLYQDFGNDLSLWVDGLERHKYNNLSHCIHFISEQMHLFLEQKKSVFRTLHLNARLHSDLISSDSAVDRAEIYQRLIALILQFDDEINTPKPEEAAGVAIFTLINTLMEKVLYPTLTPAIACQLDAQAYAKAAPDMLLAYLKN